MLAQAQACVYEKAVSKKGADKTKPSILAKIAMAASDLYSDALKGAEDSELRRKIDTTWEVNLRFQKLCFQAAANYWESISLGELAIENAEGYGKEIARLVEAENFANQAITFGQKSSVDVSNPEALKRLVLERKETAVKDNRNVYMEPVPKLSDLGKIKSVKVVKALPLPSTITATTSPLFRGLLPKKKRSALDQFNTEAQSLIDLTRDLIVAANKFSRDKLQSNDLPQSLEAHRTGNEIPNELWRKIEALRSSKGIDNNSLKQNLIRKRDEIAALAVACNNMLATTSSMLDEHLTLDSEFRRENVNFNATPIGETQSDVRRDLKHYANLLSNAKKSDQIVAQSIDSQQTDAAAETLQMHRSALDTQMPRRNPDDDDSPDIDTTALSTNLLELAKLIQTRDTAFDRLQRNVKEYDMAGKLADSSEDAEILVNRALQTFDELRIEIRSNVDQQPPMLEAILDANEKFKAAKQTDKITLEREKFLQSINSCCLHWESLNKQLVEGKNFYVSIENRLVALKQTAESQGVAMQALQCDFLDRAKNEAEQRELERRDAEYAQRIAQENDISQFAGLETRERQLSEDAAYAQKLAAELNIEDGAGDGPSSENDGTANNESNTNNDSGGLLSWFGRKQEKPANLSPTSTNLKQPLTTGDSGSGNSSVSSYGSSNSSFPGARIDAPPMPRIRGNSTEEGSYQPPVIGQPPQPPPPSFAQAQQQLQNQVNGGGMSSTIKVDESKVSNLVEMGFSSDKVRAALAANDNDSEAALNGLLAG